MKTYLFPLIVFSLICGIFFVLSDEKKQFSKYVILVSSVCALCGVVIPAISSLRSFRLPDVDLPKTAIRSAAEETSETVIEKTKEILQQQLLTDVSYRFSVPADSITVSVSIAEPKTGELQLRSVTVLLHRKCDRFLCAKIESWLSDELLCRCSVSYDGAAMPENERGDSS